MANVKVTPISPIKWWDQIHRKELYKGPYETNPPDDINLERRIPRVGWWVVDEQGFYVVSRVFEDNTSQLTRINPGQNEGYDNVITGPAIHQYTSPYILMVDPTTTPVRFRVMDTMKFYGTEPAYFKIFKGTDISTNGKVISTSVNGSGIPTNNNLPLELVQGPNGENVAVKVCRGGHLLEIPANQEQVTIVAYRADGLQVAYHLAIVCYTTNITPLDSAKKIIYKIALESPYLSQDDDHLLVYPQNMLVDSSVIMGVVTYNDGTIKRLPINGDKFKLYGHEDFVASVPGAMFDLGLTYILSDDEVAYDALGNVPIRSKTETYKIVASAPDGNFSVKVFAIPYWDSATAKYKLNWLLYNMNRDSYVDVTNFVQLTPGFTFNGSLYNQRQSLRFGINMGDIFPTLNNYRFVQNLAINLITPATTLNQPTYFTIEYSDEYRYGTGLKAVATRNITQTNQYNIDISQNCATVEEWINKIYYPSEPLRYLFGEDLPPNPTGLYVRNLSNTWRRAVDINDVLKPVTGITANITQGSTIVLELFATTADKELSLVSAPLITTLLTS